MFPCESCDKRKTCQEQCFDLSEELRKVTIGRKERYVEKRDNLEQDAFYRDYNGVFKGKELKDVIVELYNQGKSYREIAYYQGLGCHFTYVEKVVHEYKESGVYQANKRKRKHDKGLRRKQSVTKPFIEASFFHGGYFDKHR